MLKHKWTDLICVIAMVLAVALTVLMMNGEQLGLQRLSQEPAYVGRLFDDSRVHMVDIQIEDWDAFLEQAVLEQYEPCTVVIDGESFAQVGIRAKGNNSKRLVAEYGLDRYSLKLEFDHYLEGGSYFGLDKFSLDASFQDNSYMKSYLVYDMMAHMEVPSPLCSYAWVTVNGEPWGLFLALEEPEESFARRVYGKDHGQLYKPDYRSLMEENSDVALIYTDDAYESYDNIFRTARFAIDDDDRQRLITALKKLQEEEDPAAAVNVDEVLRYFAVQVFVMNWDSYLGRTGHNYFLYEEEGQLSMLPWDYNLAFGTYALGMTDPIRDPNVLINYPVSTPAEGKVMMRRPLYHTLMKNNEYFARYHLYMDQLVREYFESDIFQVKLRETARMIAPYVKQDPTAFCSYEDHRLAVDTLVEVCLLRAQSVRGQLEGSIPDTIRGQQEDTESRVDATHVDLRALGDFEDLKR